MKDREEIVSLNSLNLHLEEQMSFDKRLEKLVKSEMNILKGGNCYLCNDGNLSPRM